MGLLKKLGRGIKKVARKNVGGAKRLLKKVGPGLAMAAVGATAPALIAKAASAAKTLGKKVRGLETPKSMVPVIRAAQVKVRKTRSKLPGGAPMPPMIATPSVGMMASSEPRRAKRTLYSSGRKAKPRKAKRTITKPPTAKQLAAREKFKAMVAARRKKAA